MTSKKLRIVPLGGLGEIGRNMTLIEYGENIIVIDCGIMFPESHMLGVDLVIPNTEYLIENKNIVRGIILTHGHEDHIGALPYVLGDVPAPMYATGLTRGLIEVKLEEAGLLQSADINTVEPGDRINIGPFRLEFFHVSHSIPGAIGIAIDTPLGLIVHTGEYKFDYTPVDGQLTDFQRLADYGGRGVLCLLADSTNAEKPGYTQSEQIVSETFDRVFSRAPGRILVSTFASNISRVQQVIDTALRHGRRIGVVGRSMVNNFKMARQLGYIQISDADVIPREKLDHLPPEEVAIVCTGSQGEPFSALVRMSNRDHRWVTIHDGDTVILSATPIPGNEELVHATLNNLYRQGATVIYHQLEPVHVSGHAGREELKMMLGLTQPKYFIPVQGEYRHLVLHGELGREMGIPKDNIFVIESGQVVEFDEDGAHLAEQVAGNYVFVDGLGIGDVGQIVLRDRQHLARDGFFIVVVTVDYETGDLVHEPEVVSRGFVFMRDADALVERTKNRVVEILSNGGGNPEALNAKLRADLSRFLYNETRRRPMILPVVLEV
ncbi:MAG: Ribonuclease J1 [Anaerolineales bacterium]|nr:Ribonuclease J1 [Anaerolineales bacterium]